MSSEHLMSYPMRCRVAAAVVVGLTACFPAFAEGRAVGGAMREAVSTPSVMPPAQQRSRLDYSVVEPGLRIALTPPKRERLVVPPADGGPVRIGFHRDLPTPFHGELAGRFVWNDLADGSVVGSLTVASPEAVALRLALLAQLPAKAEIRFFSPTEPNRRFRVVTGQDFHVLPDGGLEALWSPVVAGEATGIEVMLPSRVAIPGFSLRLPKVSHRYAEVSEVAPEGLQCAGHVDVQCRIDRLLQEPPIQDAVVRIQFEEDGWAYYCSATLLNNERANHAPYLLTANHCISTSVVARSITATWFYERPACGSTEPAERGFERNLSSRLLATSRDQDATLLRHGSSLWDLPRGAVYSGWSTELVTHPTAVYGIHHPQGDYKKYSAGATTGSRSFVDDIVDGIEVEWQDGLTEPGSSGSGLFAGEHLVGVLSGGPEGCTNLDWYGNFADFYPKACPWLSPDAACAGRDIPLFLSASNSAREGFARIINRSDWAGEVQITAIDDIGARFGPVTLELGAGRAAHFNSNDLEQGRPSKGLARGVGTGQGDWRLELRSDLSIEALAYVRTADGFVTTMHDVVPAVAVASGHAYLVPFFNPASNTQQVSKLRLVNPSDVVATVQIRGIDDAGFVPSPVQLAVPAGTARTITARQLERGEGLIGAFGDRDGKWFLTVESDVALQVMNLLEAPTGNLANLSSVDSPLVDGGILPLFLPANPERQGFARVSNRSGSSGTVMIHAVDERGRLFGPVELSLAPWQTRHFNSTDLERGNPDKGLAGRLGSGVGNWTLALTTNLESVRALTYVRTADGFVTSMDDVARQADGRYAVPFFNPGSNRTQRSSLRLINLGEGDAAVTITAIDDAGRPGGDVRLTLGEDQSRTLTAQTLESGSTDIIGRLGDGTGKWRLTVRADQPIGVMSLLESPTGNLTNLSTGTAP